MASSAVGKSLCPEYYLDTDVKVDSSILKPDFRKHLETFYSKATTADDRARCLELLTALDISSAVNNRTNAYSNIHGRIARPHERRPFTACGHKEVTFNPYMTSHKRDFTGHTPCDTVGNRPRSSIAFPYPSSGKERRTTYADEFYRKSQPRMEPIRSGTATGTRRNNPHPLEAFMVWKIGRGKENRGGENAVDAARLDEIMDAALRGKLQTTYQKDFLGLPLGCRPKQPTPILPHSPLPDPPPHTLDTTTRLAFQKPSKSIPQLEVPLTRFASGIALTGSDKPTIGAVPGASKDIYLDMKGRTTYERHFTDPCSDGQMHGPQDIRQMSRRYGADALHNRLQQMAPHKEKEDLSDVLRCLDINSPMMDRTIQSPRSPTTHAAKLRSARYHHRAPQATAVGCPMHGDVRRTPILSFETP